MTEPSNRALQAAAKTRPRLSARIIRPKVKTAVSSEVMNKVASLALAGLFAYLSHGQTQRVLWEEKAPYADRILYNGQRYKTIQVMDKVNVWASMNHTKSLTVANIVIMNQGKERFDVDPEKFVCTCTGPKQKVLRHDWPFGLEKNTSLMILRANTVLPGSDRKGLVSFERIRRCDAMKLTITIEQVAFEFPFTHVGGSATGNMN